MTEQVGGCVDSQPRAREEGPAAEAHASLNEALRGSPPACEGIELFTADRLTDDDRLFCEVICSGCPVFAACEAYATASRAQAGFWAGHHYTLEGRK